MPSMFITPREAKCRMVSRSLARHFKLFLPARMPLVINDARDLWDHIAATLDFYPIANLDAKPLDLVHVVQGGAAHGGAADGHGFQFRNWRQFASAPYLHMNLFNLR